MGGWERHQTAMQIQSCSEKRKEGRVERREGGGGRSVWVREGKQERNLRLLCSPKNVW